MYTAKVRYPSCGIPSLEDWYVLFREPSELIVKAKFEDLRNKTGFRVSAMGKSFDGECIIEEETIGDPIKSRLEFITNKNVKVEAEELSIPVEIQDGEI